MVSFEQENQKEMAYFTIVLALAFMFATTLFAAISNSLDANVKTSSTSIF